MRGSYFLLGLTLNIALLSKEAKLNAQKPNVIVILVDDMGFSDLGCFGSEINTPNLDNLASNGLRFRQFYNAGRCCPTRASLISGLHPHQAGMGHMAGGALIPDQSDSYMGALNYQCVTLAEVLKPAGYFTGMLGKWHLSSGAFPVFPHLRGFDRSYMGGGFYYLTDYAGDHPIKIDGVDSSTGGDPDPDNWYSSYKFAEWGNKYIDEALSLNKPFFLYLAFNAPHFPITAPDTVVSKYRGRYSNGWSELRKERYAKQKAIGLIDDSYILTPDDDSYTSWNDLTAEQKLEQDSIMATFAACVEVMDQSVGRVVEHLKQKGILDNTLILFMSDNGGNAEGLSSGLGNNSGSGPIGTAFSYLRCGRGWANAQNTPFREYKHYIHEGGIHTSFIAHWPDGISEKGTFRDQPAHLIDIMPTLVEVSGATYPTTYNGNEIHPMQGVSLIPAFNNQSLERDTLYWEHEANRGIRISNMKCVAKVDPLRTFLPADHNKWELYDLSVDPTELNDLAVQNPQELNEMIAFWEKWANEKKILPWPWGEYEEPEPVIGNIVFHFPFDGNLIDASENAVEITNPINNSEFFSTDSTGLYGKALALSGTSDTYLHIARTALLDPSTSDYTVCAWVKNKSNEDHNVEQIILHQSDLTGSGSTRYLLACIGSGTPQSQNLQIGTFMGATNNKSNGYIPRNEWTHIAITGTNSTKTLKFYINGELDKEVITNDFEASSHGYLLGKH
jgi:arylsulfatase A-like enzyme